MDVMCRGECIILTSVLDSLLLCLVNAHEYKLHLDAKLCPGIHSFCLPYISTSADLAQVLIISHLSSFGTVS